MDLTTTECRDPSNPIKSADLSTLWPNPLTLTTAFLTVNGKKKNRLHAVLFHIFFAEEEADELSSIHDCSIQTRTEGPQSHNCSGSFPDHNSFVSPLRTEYPAVKCRPPWNSTPAQKPTQRRAVLFESPMTTRSSTPSDPQQHHNSCLLERRFVPYSPTNAIGFDTTLAFSVVSRQSHSALVSSSPSVLNSSLPVSFHSALQNSSRQSVRSDQSITDGKSQRPILPKNLLDAFEGTSSDDE